MARSGATSESVTGLGADLYLEVPAGAGLRAGLTEALREAVRSGRLAPGTRLPSSRSLAVDLSVARNTVAGAYAELVAEGWLTARQGSGTRVAPRATPRRAARRASPVLRPPRACAYSLLPGVPDLSHFPRTAWTAAARHALADAPDDAFGHGDPRGRPELRAALADYLARSRGVYADPERIVVSAGFSGGLRLLAAMLAARGDHAVAVEAYGLREHWGILENAGLGVPPLPLDEHGARTPDLPGVSAVLLTAAHQFPTGVPLSPDRRAAVVDWARASGGLVLEDDYDGEFRYDRQPVGALQGLDPERVVYLGTASKALAPGLRLGWLVLPRAVVGELLSGRGPADRAPGTPDQLTLARFLASGAYDRHVRAMRLRYRRRRDQLVAAVASRAPAVRVTGIAAGLHAVLELPPGTEESVKEAAAARGLAVEVMGRFRHPSAPAADTRDALVVGYATPSDSRWPGALDALLGSLP